jgi:hypothetical protein
VSYKFAHPFNCSSRPKSLYSSATQNFIMLGAKRVFVRGGGGDKSDLSLQENSRYFLSLNVFVLRQWNLYVVQNFWFLSVTGERQVLITLKYKMRCNSLVPLQDYL